MNVYLKQNEYIIDYLHITVAFRKSQQSTYFRYHAKKYHGNYHKAKAMYKRCHCLVLLLWNLLRADETLRSSGRANVCFDAG